MEWNGCISMMQGYLENSPVIVLGSGASMPYGLPSMGALADEIKKDPIIRADPNYANLCNAMDKSGLELAIDAVDLKQETLDNIRMVVWKAVGEKDWEYFHNNPASAPQTMVKLLEKVIAPTPNMATIVTTNYDRLPEYAADLIGATTVTGFEGELIRKFELPTSVVKTKRTRARERIVDIWKVHGSLDWFVNESKQVVSFPLSKEIPCGFRPLIVPPGKDKYSSTHEEPYRTIISKADNAFVEAGAYLCVGYGFNDEHIQPKLLAQIKKGKPIVVLARTMTDACKRHIIEAGISKYLIFEQADDSHTKVYGNGWNEIYDGQYWSLDKFLKIW